MKFAHRFVILTIILFCGPVWKTHAQTLVSKIYYDTANNVCDSANGDSYFVLSLDGPDSMRAVKKQFNMQGLQTGEWNYSSFRKKELDGKVWYRWAETGKMWRRSVYVKGELQGDDSLWFESGILKHVYRYTLGELNSAKIWHANGQLKRISTFEDEIQISAKCYTENGTDTACTPWNKQAVFPGGDQAFMQYIVHEFRYPNKLRDKEEKGSVILQFMVDRNGDIQRIKVIETSHELFAKEGIRVLEKCPKWEVGYYEGEPVSAWRRIPIRFDLK